jgi:hypothetical protein
MGSIGKATKAINGDSESNGIRNEPMTVMTLDEFGDLCAWLDGPDACDFRRAPMIPGLLSGPTAGKIFIHYKLAKYPLYRRPR